MVLQIRIVICLFLLLLVSCVKDVDFDQVDNIRLTPVFEGSFVYFDIEANQFVENGQEMISAGDLVKMDAVSESFSVNNLVRADFHFQFTNTISRNFEITLNFLDKNQEVLRALSYDIPASSGADVEVKDTVIFSGDSIGQLTSTVLLGMEIVLVDGTPGLTETSEGSVSMNSFVTIYLQVEDDK
ncbi:hypothetical protein MQE36_08645 [Zhouia spongiae]|uniref:Uncharacterized protein n=1 Tax=Zhouia spongiae TaxID=2202721 RepID=A0ABY3YRE4_9FLAO|nr:hypothetical protein [Zhouia spongiae]UNZ00393.1 hypothetical protein MQE36_08645 [Zhouia spongiae]